MELTDPTGESYDPQRCRRILERIRHLQKKINQRKGELMKDPQNLPGKHPMDDVAPSLSRRGHVNLISRDLAQVAILKALYLAVCKCDPPGGAPAWEGYPHDDDYFSWDYWEPKAQAVEAYAETAEWVLIGAFVVSEATRVIPARNLVWVP